MLIISKNQLSVVIFSIILIMGILIVPIQIVANPSIEETSIVDPQESFDDIDKNANKLEDFLDNKLQALTNLSGSGASEKFIITLNERPTARTLDYFKSVGAEILDIFTVVDAVGVRMPLPKIIQASQHPSVKMVYGDEPVRRNLKDAMPVIKADASSLSNAGYGNINGQGVSIAVIDSGVDGTHSTFGGGKIVAFKDYIYGNDDLDSSDGMTSIDYESHGTMCAGSAAGDGGGTSYKGSAPGAYIIAVATNTAYDVAVAIEWCINNKNRDFNKDGIPDGPDIITLSLGFGGTNVMDQYANAAVDNGIVFVTSAGNDGPGSGTVTSPATSPKVISVGAIDNNKNIADFSSRGPGSAGVIKPDVVAPGAWVATPAAGGGWYYASGTSISGPIVAGVCALILQYDPTLTPNEIHEILQDSAEDRGPAGPDNTYGWGVVNAVNALDTVLKVRELTASKDIVYEDEEITFGLTTSGDPSMIANYEWDFDGDGKYDYESTEPESVKHKYTESGIYTVGVRITNTHGKFAVGTKEIVINNRAPDARLELDNEMDYYYEDEVVVFNASKSWDTQSDINQLNYYWDFSDGNVTNWQTSPLYGHRFADNGEFTVTLIVKDDDGDTAEQELEVSIVNLEPVANAGQDMTVYEDELIYLYGNRSTDTYSDMPLLTYFWNFGDGLLGYGMTQNHTYVTTTANTTYTVILTVIDDDGAKSEDSILVYVLNSPPIVDAGKSKVADEDEELEFDGYGNDTISDRDDLEYQWEFGDGKKSKWSKTPRTTHKYTDEDVYVAILSVEDPKDAINSSSIIVTINNVPPEASISADTNFVDEEEIIAFSGKSSKDTSSDIGSLKYFWDFGDNTQGEGKNIEYTYLNSGKYYVNLTVIDDNNAKSKAQMDVQVVNIPPRAKISIDKQEAWVDEIIRFEASKSYDTPSDRANLTYIWDFNTKDSIQQDTVGITATHKYTKPGEYTVRLKVIDDDGESHQVTKTIIITGTEESEGDMFTSPNVENQGLFLYAGVGIAIVILLLIILMLLTRRKIYKPLRPQNEMMPEPQETGQPTIPELQQYFDSYGLVKPVYPEMLQPPEIEMQPSAVPQAYFGAGTPTPAPIPTGGYPPERPPAMSPLPQPQSAMELPQGGSGGAPQPQFYLPPGGDEQEPQSPPSSPGQEQPTAESEQKVSQTVEQQQPKPIIKEQPTEDESS